ncbi:helicase associated domain-containing protein [Streptomyces flavidovirens]|uniref:helicase associated domain-containing protein n=1 Tax=Streptomyces flavidovirens TaxID=67298 RepID=UPI0033A523F4
MPAAFPSVARQVPDRVHAVHAGAGPHVLREHQDDNGTWLARRQRKLSTHEYRAAAAPGQAGRGPGCTAAEGHSANQRGVAALAQYIAREAWTVVPAHRAPRRRHPVRLGVWLSNQKSRRDRLDEQQLAALAELGLHWAM